MSNTLVSPHTTAAVNQPGFTATNAANGNSARYSNTSSVQHSYPSHSSYGQSQPRPLSVNANGAQASVTHKGIPSPTTTAGYPSQRAQSLYNPQQQRPGSPAQGQYGHKTTTPVSSTSSAATTAAAHHNNYSSRQLPSIDASRSSQSAPAATAYNYADTQSATSIAQPTAHANIADQFNQGAITVDPIAVYDPWPEYERQQEKLRQQKVDEERKAKEAQQEEESKKEEERRRTEEEERAREAAQPKSKKPQANQKNKDQSGATDGGTAASGTEDSAAGEADKLESEIRSMMAKMRELNNKDPALLARIWEEERRAKVSKSPTAQSKPTPQPAVMQPARANQRKKAVPKETSSLATSSKPHLQAPVATQLAVARPPTPAPPRPTAHTVWPEEKKTQVASAAAEYLNQNNPTSLITPDHIVSMLDGNPSYIELCEQLEAMALKLDRAAFAKNLLTAVPDVNSASRSQAQAQSRTSGSAPLGPMNTTVAQRVQVPPAATIKRDVSTPAAHSPQYAPAVQSPLNQSYLPFPGSSKSASHSTIPIAEMGPIKPEFKHPASKEEAARKRNFNDLIDLTVMSEEDDMEPIAKRPNIGSMYSQSPGPIFDDSMDTDEGIARASNFPMPTSKHLPVVNQMHIPSSVPQFLPDELRYRAIVEPLDKKKALRRNTYNIKTIARDVLLACGRHPEERQLNGHLEILKAGLPQVNNDADLSTLRWDLIDPGRPPPGFYRNNVQAFADDADDEEDSEDEGERKAAPPRPISHTIGVPETTNARVQAISPTNPFKSKRRGRPPKSSYGDRPTPQSTHTPQNSRPTTSSMTSNMSGDSPTSSGGGTGYAALRVTQYGPDGKPLPKKKGRPVGWRKSIHGSAAAQARTNLNRYTGAMSRVKQFAPSQPSSLRNVRTGDNEPIIIHSRSPSVTYRAPQYQSFKCRWQNCKAELHNLDTLKKHVFKVHRKETWRGTLECQWDDCGREVTNVDPVTNMRMERYEPLAFSEEAKWREHLEIRHFSPLAWQFGDGPASGHSGQSHCIISMDGTKVRIDAHDSEAYLSDAQGRRVTPRVTADPSHIPGSSSTVREQSSNSKSSPAQRGRGRPPKASQEQIARETQDRLVAQKKRVGGPGIDRGGATLVNEKRRKGFLDDDQTEEEFVDAEE